MRDVRAKASVVAGEVLVELVLPLAKAVGAEVPPPLRLTASREFGSVAWAGQAFSFGGKQRLVVAALVQATRDGHEWVHQDTLLELAESDGGRLRDLFRGHPAWGTLIRSAHDAGGPPGAYRLAPAE